MRLVARVGLAGTRSRARYQTQRPVGWATPSTTPSIHRKSRRAQKTVKNEARADEGEMGSNRMAGSLHEQWWLGAGQFFPRRCRAEFPRTRPERGLTSERSAILISMSVDHCATKHLTYCGRTSLGALFGCRGLGAGADWL